MKAKLTFLFCIAALKFFAQSAGPAITFIKLNHKIGYLIDSIENEQCRCITYVDKKSFRYAALIQLPDSHVVIKIKRVNHIGYSHVQMTQAEASRLYFSASAISTSASVMDAKAEETVLKNMAGDTVGYHMADYSALKFPDFISKKTETKVAEMPEEQDQFIFFNAGAGTGTFHGINDLSYGTELGIINKKNSITIRHFKTLGTTEGGPGSVGGEPGEKISDYGVLFGQFKDCGRIVLSASAGLAYTRGIVRGEFINSTYSTSSGGWASIGSLGGGSTPDRTDNYESITISTIGIPVEAEMLVGARHKFNVSVIAYGNVNLKYSFGGLLICLRLGSAKAHKK